MVCNNIGVNDLGHLTFNGFDTVELAQQYGIDVETVRAAINVEMIKDQIITGSSTPMTP